MLQLLQFRLRVQEKVVENNLLLILHQQSVYQRFIRYFLR